MRCSGCRHGNPPGSRFCNRCGAALKAAWGGPGGSIGLYTPPYLRDGVLRSPAAVHGERKSVTVLFADVQGSTTLAGSIDAEEWHLLLDRPGGPRAARLRGRARSPERAPPLCRAAPARARVRLRGPHRAPLGRGGGGCDRRCASPRLHGPGADGAPGRSHRGAGRGGKDLCERADDAPGLGLLPLSRDRARAAQGRGGGRAGLRARGARGGGLAVRGGAVPRALGFCRTRRGAGGARRGARASPRGRGRRDRSRRRCGGRKESALLRVRRALPCPRLARDHGRGSSACCTRSRRGRRAASRRS